MLRISTIGQLVDFANEHGLREDWHEPDEQGIDARIIGTHLDNAFGSTESAYVDNGYDYSEFNVILFRREWDEEGGEYINAENLAVVNLATLFAFASGYRGNV